MLIALIKEEILFLMNDDLLVKIIQGMSVDRREGSRDHHNKKMKDFINRFEYYADSVNDSAEVGKTDKVAHFPHITASFGNNEYHYLKQTREPFHHQTHFTKPLLMHIAHSSLRPPASS